MEKIYDTVIIGGGPAGYTAAMYAARAGLSCVVVERMSVGGQMTLTDIIDNYPGFDEGIDGFTLGMKMMAGAERFGAKTEYAEVTKVQLGEKIKKTVTTNGELYSYTVIIATGADPRRLGLDGEERLVGRGIHYCAHCDGRFYKGKHVAVVGGGNSAVADALYLSRLASKVTLIHRRDELRATKIYHESLTSANNVEFMWNTTLNSYISDTRVTGARLKNVMTNEESEIYCDGIFISIGRAPCTEIFKGQITLDNNGYVVADETTRTNIDGVFAVGDVRTKTLRQVVTAVGDGAVAVHYADEYLMSLQK